MMCTKILRPILAAALLAGLAACGTNAPADVAGLSKVPRAMNPRTANVGAMGGGVAGGSGVGSGSIANASTGYGAAALSAAGH